MANYSSAERLIARLLSVSPGLKKLAKKAYQSASYLVHKKPHSFVSSNPMQSYGLNADSESFFGYYDKSPVSPDGRYILFQSSTHPTEQPPDPRMPIEVICQDLQTGDVLARIPSAAYNWQQGTKLQWSSPHRFVFNAYDTETDRYVAYVYDVAQCKVIQTLPMAIYDSFNDGFALTLSFDRLARLAPDYGYFCRMGRAYDLEALGEDGVWVLDMATGESRLILSLEMLAQLHPMPSMQGAQHSVNHIMIAPDGKRFTVIHRWYQSRRRYDRLVVTGVDGSNTTILADEGMVSHCFWHDHQHIFGFLRSGDKDAYFMLDADSGTASQVGEGIIDRFGDGHPHIHGSKIVFDTYPNKARIKMLFLYDLDSRKLEELGGFFEGLKFDGETRCDLHPRFGCNGERVFFDSVHEGRRKLYAMDLQNIGS